MDPGFIYTRPVLRITSVVWYQYVCDAKTDTYDSNRSYAAKNYAVDASGVLSILPVVPKWSGTLLVSQQPDFFSPDAVYLPRYGEERSIHQKLRLKVYTLKACLQAFLFFKFNTLIVWPK